MNAIRQGSIIRSNNGMYSVLPNNFVRRTSEQTSEKHLEILKEAEKK